ncbi:hypothetical protein [Maribacter sp. 2307UL18-2]|uniref:hypothetical protein n=1 Tax=Maribacter sp. 2307UL18-2 TaxID=3386274 RepID=UPI0039BCCEEF
MKPLFKIFVLSFILFWSCSEDEELSEVENTADIAAILDKGVTLDSISLDYATMYTSTDGFPVIAPTPVGQFAEANEILLYFDFVSSSRDAVVQYYEDLNKAYLEQGIVVDYGMPYDDKLEGMVVEVKKNTDEFRVLEEDTEQLTLIPLRKSIANILLQSMSSRYRSSTLGTWIGHFPNTMYSTLMRKNRCRIPMCSE